MIVYSIATTLLLLGLVVYNHIAVNLHVKRLSTVHNIIIEEVIESMSQNRTGRFFTSRKYKLIDSVKLAYSQDNRKQAKVKTWSKKYTTVNGLIVFKLVNRNNKPIYIG